MKTKPFNLEECMTKYGGHCVTNAGEAVEILKTDMNGADGDYPVLALVTDEYGHQGTRAYTTWGNYTTEEDGHTSEQSLRLLVDTEELFLVIVRGPAGDVIESLSKICTTAAQAETARKQRAESIEPGFTVSLQSVEIER